MAGVARNRGIVAGAMVAGEGQREKAIEVAVVDAKCARWKLGRIEMVSCVNS